MPNTCALPAHACCHVRPTFHAGRERRWLAVGGPVVEHLQRSEHRGSLEVPLRQPWFDLGGECRIEALAAPRAQEAVQSGIAVERCSGERQQLGMR